MVRRYILVFLLMFPGLGCVVPDSVRMAEVTQAVIFDEMSDSFRTWVRAVATTTDAQETAKQELLLEIEKKRGQYRAIHEQLRRYLDTGGLAEAFEGALPVLEGYLEWLGQELNTEG